MLVEDDNSLREIYQARLLAEGYEVATAKDGEEALATVPQEKPDLIIMDVMMPKISGFDTLDILRSTPATKGTKIIMMTALSQAEDKARAEKLGADRYLVKSQVTLEDIIKTAKEVLGETQNSPQDTQTATTLATSTAPNQPVTPQIGPNQTLAAPGQSVPAVDATIPPATDISTNPITPQANIATTTTDQLSAQSSATATSTQVSDAADLQPTITTMPSLQASESEITPTVDTRSSLPGPAAETTPVSLAPTSQDSKIDLTPAPPAEASAISINADGTLSNQATQLQDPSIQPVAQLDTSVIADPSIPAPSVSADPGTVIEPPSVTNDQASTQIAVEPPQSTTQETPTPSVTPTQPTDEAIDRALASSEENNTENQAVGGVRVIKPLHDLEDPKKKLNDAIAREYAAQNSRPTVGTVINPSGTNQTADNLSL